MERLCRYVWTFTQLAALSTTMGTLAEQTADFDPLQWVDPLIGSRDWGNVFAGATLPYGMAKGRLQERNIDSQLLKTLQPLRM